MSSEVARLREQLRLEIEGTYQGLHGYASVAKHEIIRQRSQRANQTFEQLMPLIGEDEAVLIIVQGLEVASQKAQQDAGQRKKYQKTRARRDQ